MREFGVFLNNNNYYKDIKRKKEKKSMKGRFNCFFIFDLFDDWVNGFWIVDCICGVNFDDGEEMVNCDECGVWVYICCFCFVRGEKFFVCDKCKSKLNRNDSEEIEVV